MPVSLMRRTKYVRITFGAWMTLGLVMTLLLASTGFAQKDGVVKIPGDSVMIRLVDVDVRAAVEILSPYLDRPIVFGEVNAGRVTLQTPNPIARKDVLPLLRSALESQNLEIVSDSSGPYRVRTKNVAQAAPPPMFSPGMIPPGAQGGATQLFVVRLSHARAPEVAATINALYGRASVLGELGGSNGPMTLSQELAQQQMAGQRAMQQGMPNQQPGVPQGGTSGGGQNRPGTLSQETTIVPDQATNSLLVRATQADYELIAAAVKEIDVRPLQVLIEMLVAEVRKDRSFNFGVDANLPQQGLGNPNTSIGGSQAGIGLGDLVIRVMGMGGIKDFDVTLRAAASRGDVTIVSRPAILAANNEQAQILVGSQRPFVQLSRSLPTDGASRDQVVQYKDVGTKLIVRPTISADGYVMLEVLQEISQATSEVQFDAPVISTRSVQTRLLLKDGQTVVLGGLRDRQREKSQSGVPVLSAIPILGGLFGRAKQSMVETELFLFITPRLIRSDAEAEGMTKPLQERSNQLTK